MEQLVARKFHTLEVDGAIPSPATIKSCRSTAMITNKIWIKDYGKRRTLTGSAKCD